MTIKKGYNNPDSWETIEKSNEKSSTKTIDLDEVETKYMTEEQESEEQESEEEASEQNIDDAFIDDQSFDEVLELTAYSDSSLTPSNQNTFVVAEYEEINTPTISDKHRIIAKKFVQKITSFILEFNDVALTEEHKVYIKQVGNLQMQHLEDLLTLTEVNKRMIANIIHRVNATQAEDYAIINSYNLLINQHLKLLRELQTTYKSIPSVLKKMKADVLCNQALEENFEEDEVITEEYGETQFNNSKQMLRSLADDYKKPNSKTE